jgi:trk system potassium uptake protein
MNVIIMGCGRVGSHLSRLLERDGHTVTVIDSDQDALNSLGADFKGRRIRGVGFDRDVLLDAGIETADAFAATSPSDNANVVAARIARNIFQVPRVVARLYDPQRAEIYRRLGLLTISTTNWGAERIHEMITHRDLDPVISFGRGEVSLVALELPPTLEGRRVKDLAISGEINVVTITRQEEAIVATPNTEFQRGDIVHMAVLSTAIDRLESMLGY